MATTANCNDHSEIASRRFLLGDKLFFMVGPPDWLFDPLHGLGRRERIVLPAMANRKRDPTIAGPLIANGQLKGNSNIGRRAGWGGLFFVGSDDFHGSQPKGRGHFDALAFFVDAGEFPGVQPEASAFGTFVNLDLLQFRKPFALEHLFRATRTKTRVSELHIADRDIPD